MLVVHERLFLPFMAMVSESGVLLRLREHFRVRGVGPLRHQG